MTAFDRAWALMKDFYFGHGTEGGWYFPPKWKMSDDWTGAEGLEEGQPKPIPMTERDTASVHFTHPVLSGEDEEDYLQYRREEGKGGSLPRPLMADTHGRLTLGVEGKGIEGGGGRLHDVDDDTRALFPHSEHWFGTNLNAYVGPDEDWDWEENPDDLPEQLVVDMEGLLRNQVHEAVHMATADEIQNEVVSGNLKRDWERWAHEFAAEHLSRPGGHNTRDRSKRSEEAKEAFRDALPSMPLYFTHTGDKAHLAEEVDE